MRIVWPPADFFISRNVPKLQYLPILLGPCTYPIEPNRYIEERCLGEWAPSIAGDEDPSVHTVKSRENLARRLCAFFHWLAQDASRDWRTLSYDDIREYQYGLQLGVASASGRPLSDGTINAYVDEACAYLAWAGERGLRDRFKVPRRRVRIRSASRGRNSFSNRGLSKGARQGALTSVESGPEALPKAIEVEKWIGAIKRRHPIKALIFELMVRTGCRVSESNRLRLGCFPRKAVWNPKWLDQGWVPIRVRYGVKGPKVTPSSDLGTKSRILQVPIDLAERIEHYLRWVRPNLLAKYHAGGRKDSCRTDRLWLGEFTHRPLSYQALYKVWTSKPDCPEDWHPHAARHFFAVEKITGVTKSFLELNGLTEKIGIGGAGWLHALLAGQVRLILSPLLGHADEKTSELYLRLALGRLLENLGHPLVRWNQLIDQDLGD
jgi:integrase